MGELMAGGAKTVKNRGVPGPCPAGLLASLLDGPVALIARPPIR
jgi:hypothetical protein